MNLFGIIFIYILVRLYSYYLFGTNLVSDVGIKGAVILATVFVFIEVSIVSIPFLFNNIVNSMSTKIYFYYVFMFIINVLLDVFLAKHINFLNIWIFELIITLIVSYKLYKHIHI